ncbi:MAG: methionine synthase [Bdellovibrionales bacterium GWB1_55_8]|nr:MAG: methionine synthase [Bdellovibrionales bacterium GWB1_55_8]
MRSDLLIHALRERILVLDGAMGTAIQARDLKAKDFGGPEFEGCNEYLVITRPDVIESIHRGYLEAGCDIIETNTFGGAALVLEEYGLGSRAFEINRIAAKLARKAADEFSTPEKPRFVAGSIGPTTKAISVTGGIEFEELERQFHDHAKALLEGGVDYFLLETCQDTRNVKAALLGIQRLFDEGSRRIPIAVSGTIEATGAMLAGQTVDAFLTSLSHIDLLYVGLNCATGPEFMTDHLRTLAALSPFPIACVPNAGLPDENGNYLESPKMVSAIVKRFINNGWVNLVGGCCGTNAEHISALSMLAKGQTPRTFSAASRSSLSGIDYLEITDETRPIIVGERTNVIGSRKFKEMITAEKYEEAAEIARVQVRNGAQIIDVCVANPDRDELKDMRSFMGQLVRKVRAPIMIDSTDVGVIASALTYCQGKSIINSVNLENGEERIAQIAPLARRFGAALVVGTIDEDAKQGMALTRQRKLEIAQRTHDLLTKKYGFASEDLYFDPLVFPCASGDAQYTGSAVETIEGLRAIKSAFPRCRTVLGISNVSFGLPQAGREVLNSVFLYHCVQAGLDLAIVNSEKLERYAGIPEKERQLSENLLFVRGGGDRVAAFAAHFRNKKTPEPLSQRAQLPLLERLSRYVIEGAKDGLQADLDQALRSMKPLEIINGPLMSGMDEVGRLFNKNQLIVAEVLQSAEVMKAAVNHLEPYMEKSASASRGKVLLATVKGDVHDIGKNLVEIILTNNGFDVINLGIKVPPEQLIEAARKHQPDMIGLSGLLVKSAHQMLATAEDFAKAGIKLPLLLGGAALTRSYVDRHIAKVYEGGTVTYASDAMNGLELAKTVVNSEKFAKFRSELAEGRAKLAESRPVAAPPPSVSQIRSSAVAILPELPSPPDFERHLIRNTPLEQIWGFINPLMLYGRHLGVKGSVARLLPHISDPKIRHELEINDPGSLEVADTVEVIKNEFRNTEVLQPAAVYQFFRAFSQGNSIELLDENEKTCANFSFPRQPGNNGLCLADYVSPKGGSADSVALFVVTVGRGVRELAEALKNRGEYLRSHVLQALAIELAEGYAELLHARLRAMWGYPDPVELSSIERFQARYRGKRYSFGYPACPRLDDQQILFQALRAEEIGVQLTEGMMMDPESSVSGIAFHHPAAVYFSVGTQGGSDEDQR